MDNTVEHSISILSRMFFCLFGTPRNDGFRYNGLGGTKGKHHGVEFKLENGPWWN